MMLENVPEGGVVGLPVPLGYDDVLVSSHHKSLHEDLLM